MVIFNIYRTYKKCKTKHLRHISVRFQSSLTQETLVRDVKSYPRVSETFLSCDLIGVIFYMSCTPDLTMFFFCLTSPKRPNVKPTLCQWQDTKMALTSSSFLNLLDSNGEKKNQTPIKVQDLEMSATLR